MDLVWVKVAIISIISHALGPHTLVHSMPHAANIPPHNYIVQKTRSPPLPCDHNDPPLQHSSDRSGCLSSGLPATPKLSSRPPATRRESGSKLENRQLAPLHSRIRASCSCHLHGWPPFPTDSANNKNKNLLMLAFSSPSNSTIVQDNNPLPYLFPLLFIIPSRITTTRKKKRITCMLV